MELIILKQLNIAYFIIGELVFLIFRLLKYLIRTLTNKLENYEV
jgi:hypothetical protein